MVTAKRKTTPKRTKSGRFAAGKPAVPLNVEPRLEDYEVYRELNRGKNPHQVSLEFKISWHTVMAIKSRMDEFFRRELWDDIVKLKADHSAKLLDLYEETRQAFEASKNPTVRSTTSDKAGDSTTETTSSGDPRFALASMTALSDIRKIWGADAPLKVEHSGELRVAGKTQEEADAAIIEHVQGLLKQLAN